MYMYVPYVSCSITLTLHILIILLVSIANPFPFPEPVINWIVATLKKVLFGRGWGRGGDIFTHVHVVTFPSRCVYRTNWHHRETLILKLSRSTGIHIGMAQKKWQPIQTYGKCAPWIPGITLTPSSYFRNQPSFSTTEWAVRAVKQLVYVESSFFLFFSSSFFLIFLHYMHCLRSLEPGSLPPSVNSLILCAEDQQRNRAWKILVTCWTSMLFRGHGFELVVGIANAYWHSYMIKAWICTRRERAWFEMCLRNQLTP